MDKTNSYRIVLDASTRRFQAHKIYLRAAAGMRWVQLRKQVLSGHANSDKLTAALSAVDTRLRAVSYIHVIDQHDLRKSHVPGAARAPHPYQAFDLQTSFTNTVFQELTNITDESVVNDLRDADRRKNYWLDEDPALERMLAWIRRQR